ncbi:MAG: glycosyltransferase family 39 protein [Elusimicrobia bacterium]|nr:glycosyltransferase family 39 protein [Candidatus Obscuribacterium magneticum]
MVKSILSYIDKRLDALSRTKWVIPVLFLLGFVTRFVGAYFGETRGDDDGIYLTMARYFLGGQGFGFVYHNFGFLYSWLPPGMGMLRALFLTLFPANELLALRFFFILLTSSTIVVHFLLAKRLFPPKYALLATLMWILYVPQWFWGSRIDGKNYAENLTVISLYLLFLSWEKRSNWLAFLIGILWTSVTLMRGEFLFVVAVMAVTSILHHGKNFTGFRTASLLLLGCGLAFAPWIIRNYRIHKRFVLISTNFYDACQKAFREGYDFSGDDPSYSPELMARLKAAPGEVERGKVFKEEVIHFIKGHPLGAARVVIGNYLNFWRPWVSLSKASLKEGMVYVVSYVPLFILFVVALFRIPWKNSFWLTIVGIIFYKSFIHVLFYTIVAFRETIMPLVIVVATYPLVRYWETKLK